MSASFAMLQHRLARLAHLQPAELPHRLHEQWLRQTGRRLRLHLPTQLAQAPAPRWPGLDAALAPALAEPMRQALAEAHHAALSAGLPLMSATIPASARDDFSRDPWTGEPWPSGYCFDLALHHPGRDVRAYWELLRAQHLPLLALHARRNDDAAAREACLATLRALLQATQPWQSLGWASGIEVACRATTLLLSFAILDTAVPAALREALWQHLYACGTWLARFPSIHSSANNHRVAELGGLVALGALAPQLPGAQAWLQEGLAGFTEVLPLQQHEDGVGTEQSPSYQAFSLEWALLARHLAAAAGTPLDPALDAQLARGAAYLTALCDQGHEPPAIGDDDEGRVLRASIGREPGYVCSVAGLAGAVAGTARPPAWQPDLRWLLLGAPEPAAPAALADQHFPVGGYTIHVRQIHGQRWHLVFDHGPLGFPHLGAHGHADALALWLSIDGQPALRDAGTYSYNESPALRRWFRSAAAHNTCTIAGQEPSTQQGAFAWSRRAAPRFTGTPDAPEANHDGYASQGLTLWRRLAWSEHGLTVRDAVTGGHAPLQQRWWPASPALRIDAPAQRPIQGEHSPAYGAHAPSQGVEVTGNAVLLTTLTSEGPR